jgi:hypothetical protein
MKLELIQPVFGDSAGHLDLRWGSSLSWSDHNPLRDAAAGAMAAAHEAALARSCLMRVGEVRAMN